MSNSRVVFASYPGFKTPTLSNFRYEKCPYPSEDLNDGEVLIKNGYLSVDPAQRCQMNEKMCEGVNYIDTWKLGDTIHGLHGVGKIVKSANERFAVGDIVMGAFDWPWEEYFTLYGGKSDDPGVKLHKLEKQLIGNDPSLGISLYGIPGPTALIGLWEKAHIKPGANQTIVVSGAAGSCGSLAGQFARLLGANRVVGICGSKIKCNWLTNELGFDAAIDYKNEDVAERLKETCPNGVDSYFDNVGSTISDAVIKQMKPDSHIVLCGQIAVYNEDLPYPPPIKESTANILRDKNIARDRFTFMDYPGSLQPALMQIASWYRNEKFKIGVTVAEGLENAGKAYVDMMAGQNMGKQLVHVADLS